MKRVGIAEQLRALRKVSETSFYEGRLGDWYGKIMNVESIDVDLVSSTLAPSGFLVDLMCGNGRLLSKLADKGFSGIGIDSNEQAIATAKISATEFTNYEVADAFNWQPSRKVDAVFLGGLAISMFNKVELRSLLGHIRTYLKPSGVIYFDYLPLLDIDPGYFGDFVLPVLDRNSDSFVISSTVRDPKERLLKTSFYMQLVENGTIKSEFASHSLRLISDNEMRLLLEDSGFQVTNSFDSYQFDDQKMDESLPYWPVRKIRAMASN